MFHGVIEKIKVAQFFRHGAYLFFQEKRDVTFNSTVGPLLVPVYVGAPCKCLVVSVNSQLSRCGSISYCRSFASNLEQVANLLCAQANSASYPSWDGK